MGSLGDSNLGIYSDGGGGQSTLLPFLPDILFKKHNAVVHSQPS